MNHTFPPPFRARRRRLACVAALAVVLGSGALTSPESAIAGAGAAGGECAGFGPATQTGVVADPAIDEASGLVASRAEPGVFWTHNDNAGENRVFALDETGRALGSVRLEGANPANPEDIAIGPGPGGADHLYLADIGDNSAQRSSVRIYRFREPRTDELRAGQVVLRSDQYEVLPVRYRSPADPNATWSRNAEALTVDPVTHRVYVFEKEYNWIDRPRMAWVYAADIALLRPGVVTVLEPVVAVASNVFTADTAGFTAADISGDGRLVVAKNRLDVFTWLRAPGETVETALARAPSEACRGTNGVGEALAVRADGTGYVMVREGASSPVWQVPAQIPVADWMCGGLVPSLVGTPADDVLLGGPGRDVIVGWPGHDFVDAGVGDDVVCGNADGDVLLGGPGADVIHGGPGADVLSGGPDRDRLFGQADEDLFDGSDPADSIVAGRTDREG